MLISTFVELSIGPVSVGGKAGQGAPARHAAPCPPSVRAPAGRARAVPSRNMPGGGWTWVSVGLAAAGALGWAAALTRPGHVGAGVRLTGTVALLAAGAAVGYSVPPGPAPVRVVCGALVGYLAGHAAGWALDTVHRRGLRGTRLHRNPPAVAREYRLRTVLLPGPTVAGLATGIAGAGGGLGMLILVALAVLRREFLGAPLVALVLALVVVLVPLGMLRARAMREVRIWLDDELLELRYRRRGQDWHVLPVPLARIRSVTVFADPYGRGRMLRVDAGDAGRFELRAAPVLSTRGAGETLRRASRDLLGRPGWRPASGRRALWSRWGTRCYRAPASNNG